MQWVLKNAAGFENVAKTRLLELTLDFKRPYLDVVNEDLPESGREHVPGHLGGTVTDVGHLVHALEAPPHPVVNTLGTPPVLLDLVIPVALLANGVPGLTTNSFLFFWLFAIKNH